MLLPKKVQRGQAITADWANSVVDFLRSIRPVNGVNILVKQTANGTTFSSSNKKAGVASKTRFPLTAYAAGGNENEIKIKIEPGMVSNLEPKIGGDFFSNKDTFLSMSKSGTYYLFLRLEYSDEFANSPNGVFVQTTSTDLSLDQEEGTKTYAYIKLCKVLDGSITNYLSGSLSTHFCSPHLFYWGV